MNSGFSNQAGQSQKSIKSVTSIRRQPAWRSEILLTPMQKPIKKNEEK